MEINDKKRLLFSIILLLTVFSGIGSLLIILSYSIPNELIEDNIRLSREILEEENAYDGWTEVFTHGWAGNLDTTTDVRIFKDAVVKPGEGAVRAAFGTYSRMWNGYMVIFRPMLVLFSYAQIRFFLYAVITILSWYICSLLHTRLGADISFSYIIALTSVNIILVPFNLIMSIFIMVMSLFSIWILRYYKSSISLYRLFLVFMIFGMTDIYFDMLTAPLLIPCVPLLMILLIDAAGNKETETGKSLVKAAGCLISWGVGYGCFWLIKWILSTLVTGENVMADALNTIFYRAGGEAEGQAGGPLYSIAKNLGALLPTHGENLPGIIGVILVILILMTVVIIKKRPDMSRLKPYLPCFPVILLPLAWYAVICNHSVIHATMYSYRLLMIPVFGLLSVYFILIRD